MMRFAAGTLDRAFQIKEKGMIVQVLGRESGLTDVFYCTGMVGIFVMLYLQQVVFRNSHYFDTVIYYTRMLSDEEKLRVI
jgi:hypothetical protein